MIFAFLMFSVCSIFIIKKLALLGKPIKEAGG